MADTPLPQSQTETQAGVAPYAQPYVGSMLGATMGQLFNTDPSGNITGLRPYTPYSYNPADYIAGFSPLQQQAQYAATNMQLPGQFGPASYLASSAGMGSLGLMPAAMGYGQQASMAGQQYANQATNPYAVGAYMSPYMQNVVDVQSQQAKRQAAIAQQQQQAQAARAGAFGGGRDIVQRAQSNAELQRNLQNIQATGSQNAYQQALQNMQFGSALGLQGLQAGLQGVNAAQQSANAANQAAGTLGTLGGQQQASQAAQIALLNQLGQQQQQQQQNIINQAVQNYQTAQQYPFTQLGFMQNMLGGLPISTSSQQIYQAAPSIVPQIAALGLGLGSLMGGTGGQGGTGGGLTGVLNSIGGLGASAFNWLKGLGGNSLSSISPSAFLNDQGYMEVPGSLGFAEGGAVQAQPAGLVDLAISKM